MTEYKATPEQWANIEGRVCDELSCYLSILELRARIEQLEANSLAGIASSNNTSTSSAVPPPNCRQRLQREGKPYPKSHCEACGTMSPMWRQCDATLALEAANSNSTPNPSQIRSSLVERVSCAIDGRINPDQWLHQDAARAAIREVARWIDAEARERGLQTHNGVYSAAAWLRGELEQEAER